MKKITKWSQKNKLLYGNSPLSDEQLESIKKAKKTFRKGAYFYYIEIKTICRVVETNVVHPVSTRNVPGIQFCTAPFVQLRGDDYLSLSRTNIRPATQREKARFQKKVQETLEKKYSEKALRRRFRAVQKKHRDEIRYVKQQHKEEKAAIQSALK